MDRAERSEGGSPLTRDGTLRRSRGRVGGRDPPPLPLGEMERRRPAGRGWPTDPNTGRSRCTRTSYFRNVVHRTTTCNLRRVVHVIKWLPYRRTTRGAMRTSSAPTHSQQRGGASCAFVLVMTLVFGRVNGTLDPTVALTVGTGDSATVLQALALEAAAKLSAASGVACTKRTAWWTDLQRWWRAGRPGQHRHGRRGLHRTPGLRCEALVVCGGTLPRGDPPLA